MEESRLPGRVFSHPFLYRGILVLIFISWINIHPWPLLDDQAYRVLSGGSEQQFAGIFAEYATGKQFFLIIDLDEFADQTALAAYLIYDLRGNP